ncbi:helix-turn-helix transcriptional regulator [Kitasatospora sp. NPDC094016]|uniref:helix-turn-helix transcriptional regulator n=1 Tax=Kitasatospora sp. NPDC094016 TaxID=3154986 RepID=UPI003323D28A
MFRAPAACTVGSLCEVCLTPVTLTPSEAKQLTWLAADLSTRQIARHAEVGVSTVQVYLRRLSRTLGASTWPQAVDHACRTNLLTPQPTRLAYPLPARDLDIFQSHANGRATAEIAAQHDLNEYSINRSLARTRRRLGASGSPATVYRLHAAKLLTRDPVCPDCTAGGPS